MALALNGQAAMDQVRREGAARLLRAAVYFQAEHMRRVGKSNPQPYKTPSLEGDYPRKRTGAGQAGVVYAPDTPEQIAREGRVRIGQMANSWYMLLLEFHRNRLGYQQTLADLRPRIAAILGLKGGPTVAAGS